MEDLSQDRGLGLVAVDLVAFSLAWISAWAGFRARLFALS